MINLLAFLGLIVLFLIFFLLGLVLFAFNSIRKFLGLGGNRRTNQGNPFGNTNGQNAYNQTNNADSTPSSKHKKVFSSDEGEYIEFKEED